MKVMKTETETFEMNAYETSLLYLQKPVVMFPLAPSLEGFIKLKALSWWRSHKLIWFSIINLAFAAFCSHLCFGVGGCSSSNCEVPYWRWLGPNAVEDVSCQMLAIPDRRTHLPSNHQTQGHHHSHRCKARSHSLQKP